MVESKKTFLAAELNFAMSIAIEFNKQAGFKNIDDLPETKEDQRLFREMLREYNFEIEEFKDGNDTEADRKPTPNNFDAYFADLGKNVREQRKKLSEG